jgi:CheY-like chemotaxis protein
MRILYVEDNPANLFLVQRIARMDNHEVINYTNGETAIERFERDRPDLVLMDLQLEGKMTGLDVVKALRAAGHQIPIIAVTAYAMMGDKERCLEAGCTAYIAKPIPVGDLVELIKRYAAKAVTRTVTHEMVAAAMSDKPAPTLAEPAPIAAKPEPVPDVPKPAEPAPAATSEKAAPPASAEAAPATPPKLEAVLPPVKDAAPAVSTVMAEPASKAEPPAAQPVKDAAPTASTVMAEPASKAEPPASQDSKEAETKPEKKATEVDEDATLPSRSSGFMVMAEKPTEDTTQKASQ